MFLISIVDHCGDALKLLIFITDYKFSKFSQMQHLYRLNTNLTDAVYFKNTDFSA